MRHRMDNDFIPYDSQPTSIDDETEELSADYVEHDAHEGDQLSSPMLPRLSRNSEPNEGVHPARRQTTGA